jgi:hypothetical protein
MSNCIFSDRVFTHSGHKAAVDPVPTNVRNRPASRTCAIYRLSDARLCRRFAGFSPARLCTAVKNVVDVTASSYFYTVGPAPSSQLRIWWPIVRPPLVAAKSSRTYFASLGSTEEPSGQKKQSESWGTSTYGKRQSNTLRRPVSDFCAPRGRYHAWNFDGNLALENRIRNA